MSKAGQQKEIHNYWNVTRLALDGDNLTAVSEGVSLLKPRAFTFRIQVAGSAYLP